jgi:hypothetical protein
MEINVFLAIKVEIILNNRLIFHYPMHLFLHGWCFAYFVDVMCNPFAINQITYDKILVKVLLIDRCYSFVRRKREKPLFTHEVSTCRTIDVKLATTATSHQKPFDAIPTTDDVKLRRQHWLSSNPTTASSTLIKPKINKMFSFTRYTLPLNLMVRIRQAIEWSVHDCGNEIKFTKPFSSCQHPRLGVSDRLQLWTIINNLGTIPMPWWLQHCVRTYKIAHGFCFLFLSMCFRAEEVICVLMLRYRPDDSVKITLTLPYAKSWVA